MTTLKLSFSNGLLDSYKTDTVSYYSNRNENEFAYKVNGDCFIVDRNKVLDDLPLCTNLEINISCTSDILDVDDLFEHDKIEINLSEVDKEFYGLSVDKFEYIVYNLEKYTNVTNVFLNDDTYSIYRYKKSIIPISRVLIKLPPSIKSLKFDNYVPKTIDDVIRVNPELRINELSIDNSSKDFHYDIIEIVDTIDYDFMKHVKILNLYLKYFECEYVGDDYNYNVLCNYSNYVMLERLNFYFYVKQFSFIDINKLVTVMKNNNKTKTDIQLIDNDDITYGTYLTSELILSYGCTIKFYERKEIKVNELK